VVRPGSLDLP
nr:Chain B, SH3 domain-binding protein 5 [Homo sapiens]4H3B_D Chain D, SH3 domain-binding protein 5 [Homo sapiens]